MSPIDVEFAVVRKPTGQRWWNAPYVAADVMQLVIGCALGGFAIYCAGLIG